MPMVPGLTEFSRISSGPRASASAFGQHDDPALSGGVDDGERGAGDAAHAGHQHDAAALASGLHLACGGLRAEQRSLQVDGHQPAEVLFGDVRAVPLQGDPGVDDHHVDADFRVAVYQRVDLAAAVAVGPDERGVSVQGTDLLDGGNAAPRSASVMSEAMTARAPWACGLDRRGAPEPTRRAGDDHDLAAEDAAHGNRLCFRAGRLSVRAKPLPACTVKEIAGHSTERNPGSACGRGMDRCREGCACSGSWPWPRQKPAARRAGRLPA